MTRSALAVATLLLGACVGPESGLPGATVTRDPLEPTEALGGVGSAEGEPEAYGARVAPILKSTPPEQATVLRWLVAVEAEVYARTPRGRELLGQRRGSGVAVAGAVVTARATLRPQDDEPALATVCALHRERGHTIEIDYAIACFDEDLGRFVRTHSTSGDPGGLHLGVVDEAEATVEVNVAVSFMGGEQRRQVRCVPADAGGLGVLLPAGARPEAQVRSPPGSRDCLMALGIADDLGSLASVIEGVDQTTLPLRQPTPLSLLGAPVGPIGGEGQFNLADGWCFKDPNGGWSKGWLVGVVSGRTAAAVTFTPIAHGLDLIRRSRELGLGPRARLTVVAPERYSGALYRGRLDKPERAKLVMRFIWVEGQGWSWALEPGIYSAWVEGEGPWIVEVGEDEHVKLELPPPASPQELVPVLPTKPHWVDHYPSWHALGVFLPWVEVPGQPGVLQSRSYSDPEAEVLDLDPEMSWFDCVRPAPNSARDLPTQGDGITLKLSAATSTKEELRWRVVLGSEGGPVNRGHERRNENAFPLLFAFESQGKWLRTPQPRGGILLGGNKHWGKLVAAGGEKTWTLRVSQASLVALLPKPLPERVTVYAVFCERQHKPLDFASDSLPLPVREFGVPVPHARLVRSEGLVLNLR